MKIRIRIPRKKPEPERELSEAQDRIEVAREERKVSQRRLSEVQPLRHQLFEMWRKNHVGEYLDAVVQKRGGK